MSEEYLLVVDGKPQGPFSIGQLKEMRIKPADFVKTPAMIDYKEAHEVAELRALFGFKRQLAAPQYFGGFDQRLMAWALDWFFVMGACTLLAFPIVLVNSDKATRMVILFCIPAAGVLVNFVYHVMMESSVRQATYGKQIIKLKVCDIDGLRISTGRSLGRNLAKILSSAPLGFGYLLSFFNHRQQCLHDFVAETIVTKERLF